jgi:hypothetical protein
MPPLLLTPPTIRNKNKDDLRGRWIWHILWRNIGILGSEEIRLSTLHGAETFLQSHQSLSCLRNFLRFIEPEGSLLCSQEPTTDICPEPD